MADFNFTTYCEESMNESMVDCALWSVSFFLCCCSSVDRVGEGYRNVDLVFPLLRLHRKLEEGYKS